VLACTVPAPAANTEGARWAGRDKTSERHTSGIDLFPLGGGRYRVDTAVEFVYGETFFLPSIQYIIF
jgi:hypothetical protein